MQLSEHFSLAELTKSNAGDKAGLKNVPHEHDLENLKRLCAVMLEPLRTKLDQPITVFSGFRGPEINKLVGGSKTSDHMIGCAADIIVHGMTPLELCKFIDASGLPYKQIIHEFGQWCHVSIPAEGVAPKREKLTAKKVNGKTVYERGLVAV